MKILETKRLIMRRLTIDDAAFMLELMNERGFIQFVADRGLRTTGDAAAFLSEKILPSYARFGFGFYRVELRTSGIAIGICGLIKRDSIEAPDIGFAILERFAGQGYISEAAAAVFEYGQTVLGLPRIVGITSPANCISIHLLEKLGLRFEKKIHLAGYGPESLLFG